jgi:hypothetical protein
LSPNTWDGYVNVTGPSGDVLWGERLNPGEFIDLFRVAAGPSGKAYVLVTRNIVARLSPPGSKP